MRLLVPASLALSLNAAAQEAPAPAATPPAGEASAPAPEPAVEPASSATLDELKQRIDDLERLVKGQQGQLDKATKELETQRAGLAEARLKLAAPDTWKLELSGYYRARGYVFGAGGGNGNVPAGALFKDQPTSGQYLNQRLRLGAKFSYKNVASLNVHAQALDNVLWGDNADIGSAPLFAEKPSNTTIDGVTIPSVEVFRAWTEFRIPIGQFRVGRMPSQWGLGILVNDGDGFKNDFGEAYYGSEFDRILFGTNPVSLIQAFTKKKEKKEIPLTAVIAYDRLVSDPLTQYYGYKCSEGVSRVDRPADYDPRCDSDADGITDLDHSWTEERNESQRADSWWADQVDDVNEMVFALVYRGQDIKYFGGIGDATLGGYIIHRWQDETASSAQILDLWLDASVHGAIVQFEGVAITGVTRALALPSSQDPEDPLLKQASILSYVARVGYEKQWFKGIFESGFASGDDQVNDPLFTGRALHPDYNVGLLLYEEVFKRITGGLYGESARGLRSRGGVYNSHYLNPKLYFTPMANTTIILGGLVAFPDKTDGTIVLQKCADLPDGFEAKPGITCGDAAIMGWELDLAVKHKFQKFISVSLEAGYAKASDRLPLEAVGLNPTGDFFTFQARAAWEF